MLLTLYMIVAWCVHTVSTTEAERALIAKLMQGYTKFERPVANDSSAVEVKLFITMQQIIDVVSVCAARARTLHRMNKIKF
jgi:hypothetical protein